jgi:hypothetical protein
VSQHLPSQGRAAWGRVDGYDKTAIVELGWQRETELPRVRGLADLEEGHRGHRQVARATTFALRIHRLAILVHPGCDPTLPYPALVKRKSATLILGFAPWAL